ncbi:hypothetical protein SBV1_80002 [Verrucomicrobia bacterium]|nr:hypothetical protein SBV1_80002 [Verrucomicrobiota bacterium]
MLELCLETGTYFCTEPKPRGGDVLATLPVVRCTPFGVRERFARKPAGKMSKLQRRAGDCRPHLSERGLE